MSKEHILVAALADSNVQEVVKKCILEMPKECFCEAKIRDIFTHFKDSKDLLDLSNEQLKFLSDKLVSDDYKVFSGSSIANQTTRSSCPVLPN